MKNHYITTDGFNNLKHEFDSLIVERKAAVIDLTKARELGDLSENGYYKSARFKLSQIDRRQRQLKRLISTALIISKSASANIDIGDSITLIKDGIKKIYTIVGSFEANPSENKVSYISPLGKALLGKKVNEKIIVKTPSSNIEYTILNVTKLN